MPKPERFVYVCNNQRPQGHPRGSCAQKGSGATLMKFAELMEGCGLQGKVTLVQTGCMGPCMEGPLVAVYPDNTWYKEVSPTDAERIVEDHLVADKPVEAKLMTEGDWD